MEKFSRTFDRKFWGYSQHFTRLEQVVEEIAKERGYNIQHNGEHNIQHNEEYTYTSESDWTIQAEGQTYRLRKTATSKDNKNSETIEYEEASFALMKDADAQCLQVKVYSSYGSNIDGSIDWFNSSQVEGSLLEDDPFARLIYKKIIEYYDKIDIIK